MANINEDLTEPAGFLLASRNFYALVVLAQAFLLINGEYLYDISMAAASVYLFLPGTMIFHLLTFTKTRNGRPMSWEDLEKSMLARRDPIGRYLRSAGYNITYYSVAVQLTYAALAFGISYTTLLGLVNAGLLDVGSIGPVAARSALITTLILVAPAETLLFHATIPIWLENMVKGSKHATAIMYVGSQAIFAGFHYAAYGGSLPSMAFALGLGIVFLWIARTWGLPAAMATHFSWNIAVYGIGTAPLLGA